MKAILLPVLLLTFFVQAQPKLVTTLHLDGSAAGGSILRVDLPGTGPGVIRPFNNLSPHKPIGGVTPGDTDWLYGMLRYNGTNANGALYRIKQDGTDFTKLVNTSVLFSQPPLPYYHTDGKIYFDNGPNLRSYDPVANSFFDLPAFNGVNTHNLCIDDDDWIYYPSSGALTKMSTDGLQFSTIYTFNSSTEGNTGIPGVTEIPGDILFGANTSGGLFDGGTLYSINKDGTGFTVHHQFTATTGINPYSKLIYFDGKLFGTTFQGGDFNFGVLFTINPDGTGYRVLHHFDGGATSAYTSGNITIASNGRIFGSFSQYYQSGFTNYKLFKIDTSGENFEPIFSLDQREGGSFMQDVTLLPDGETIFQTSAELGHHDGGTFNRCDTSGNGAGLYQFGFQPDGFRPNALIKASDGKLYGTTLRGGIDGSGVIFSVNQNGTGYTELHEFDYDNEGYDPPGKLLEASDGRLYGACRWGGINFSGCIFRINKNGTGFQLIYTFPSGNGVSPVGSLVEDNAGRLFGTTFYSSGGFGTIFRINKDGSGYTVLRHFASSPSDLGNPYDGLTISGNNLYGSGGYGGVNNKGGIFRIGTDGSGFTILHEFTGADGELPTQPPIMAADGKLYGNVAYGGTFNEGAIYRMDSTGNNFTVLKHFSTTTEGGYPWGPVIQASDGLLYGVTNVSVNGTSDYGGSIYRINPDGSNFTTIRYFNVETEGQGAYNLLDLNGSFVVLPVDLLTFDAEKREQTTFLTWKTAQEENSRSFEIERSTEANRFNVIGTVAAAGNTNSITAYSFTDLHPQDGVNYYRLRQTDIDGQFTYSKTIPVNFGTPDKMLVSPNPATDRLNIRLPKNKRYTNLQIIDASGKIVMQQTIAASTINISLDIYHLPKGWYVLNINGEASQQQSFLKQ